MTVQHVTSCPWHGHKKTSSDRRRIDGGRVPVPATSRKKNPQRNGTALLVLLNLTPITLPLPGDPAHLRGLKYALGWELKADLFLFPSNVECSPIVLFECMASRTPFLATDVGNATEIIALSGGGVCLPTKIARNGESRATIRESAPLLEELSEDSERRRSMAESGFRTWK